MIQAEISYQESKQIEIVEYRYGGLFKIKFNINNNIITELSIEQYSVGIIFETKDSNLIEFIMSSLSQLESKFLKN